MEKKKNIAVKIFLILFLLFSHSLALADEPPSWREFEIKSENNKYIAEIKVKNRIKNSSQKDWNYKLTVFEIGQALRKEIWSCDYDYDGYSDGLLSDDGSTFVYINFWYYDNQPAVSIYRKGVRSGVLYGRDFKINKRKLRKTISHRVWLDDEYPYARFISSENLPLALEINTIDGKKHIVDLESNEILRVGNKSTAQTTRNHKTLYVMPCEAMRYKTNT